MSKSINSCNFTGNLTRDAELRTASNGFKVAAFGLAVTDAWTDRETGERRERVNFFDMEIVGPRAEKLAAYLKKGIKVAVQAQARWSRWEGADGKARTAVSFRVGQIEFLSRPKDAVDAAAEDDSTVIEPEPYTQDIPF